MFLLACNVVMPIMQTTSFVEEEEEEEEEAEEEEGEEEECFCELMVFVELESKLTTGT